MIASLTLALMLQAAVAKEPPAVWIAHMTLHAKGLNDTEVTVAQRYASCISMPHFPMPNEFTAKREKCRRLSSSANESQKLLGVFDSLDSLVRDHPGSEASLKVIKE